MNQTEDSQSQMPLSLALLPIVILISALGWNVYVFGDDALSGSSQMLIILVSGLVAAIGMARGISWQTHQKAIVSTLSTAVPSILILLLVGTLASIWLLCGTVPALVYYGLQILNPTIFLLACCIICAITSVVSGSSWSTAATIGVAMVGVGRALGVPDGMIAGSIISGSYFGDKVSPLSDTTNLAAAVSETPLFTHIRYLFLTTGPSIAITLVAFTVLGLTLDISGTTDIQTELAAIDSRFNINAWLLLPPVIVLGLIVKRVEAIPALFIGVMVGIFMALIFQQELIKHLLQVSDNSTLYSLMMTTLYSGVGITTDSALLSQLFNSSGMSGMLQTVWLIIAAMTFGGAMEACGALARIMQTIKSFAKGFFSLVSCTVGTCLITNVSASDQYISVTIPGRMYADLYKDMGYESQNLSRTLEDSGTVTSVLIPWNTCGAYHAAVLGIGTLTYLPYCFFNLLSPLMTLLFAYARIKIARISDNKNQLKQAVEG